MNRVMIGWLAAAMLTAAGAAPAPFETSIGEELPRFTVTTTEGAQWQSAGEADATVIVVFDPQSAVSRELLAPLESFVWKDLRDMDKRVRVLAIARGADAGQARAIAREMGLTFDVAPDPDRGLTELFAPDGRGVPRVLIANAEGAIAYQHGGFRAGREAEFLHMARVIAERGALSGFVPAGARGGGGGDSALGAIDIRGQQAPQLFVERWITTDPGDTAGKYVMTEFWATWCGPCRVTMPHLQQISVSHKDRLVVRSISNEPAEPVAKFVRDNEYTYPIGIDTQDRTRQRLQVLGIPHAYIENPDGIVVWQGHPAELQFDEGLLERILSGEENPPARQE